MTSAKELDLFTKNFINFPHLPPISKNDFSIQTNINYYFQIINLEYTTHWVLFFKFNNICYYFDSFGEMPCEVVIGECFKNNYRLFYNIKQYQKIGEINCGEWCLYELFKLCNFFIKWEK